MMHYSLNYKYMAYVTPEEFEEAVAQDLSRVGLTPQKVKDLHIGEFKRELPVKCRIKDILVSIIRPR